MLKIIDKPVRALPIINKRIYSYIAIYIILVNRISVKKLNNLRPCYIITLKKT